MANTIIQSSNSQRAMTPKIARTELWFLYTALLLNVIYLCVKSEVTSFYTLEVMANTINQSSNSQRAMTPKIARIELWFFYTALLLNVIYLCVKSEVTSFYTLKLCPGQKSIVKIYKGQ